MTLTILIATHALAAIAGACFGAQTAWRSVGYGSEKLFHWIDCIHRAWFRR